MDINLIHIFKEMLLKLFWLRKTGRHRLLNGGTFVHLGVGVFPDERRMWNSEGGNGILCFWLSAPIVFIAELVDVLGVFGIDAILLVSDLVDVLNEERITCWKD